MKKKTSDFWLLILFIIIIISSIFINVQVNLVLFFISAVIVFIMQKLFKFIFEKLDMNDSKQNMFVLKYSVLLYFIIAIILNFNDIINFNSLTIILVLNIITLFLTILLIYQFCRRKRGNNFSNFSLFLSMFLLSGLLCLFKYDIRLITIIFPLFSLYLLEGFDYDSIKRKKNIIRLFLIVVLFLLFGFFNKFAIFFLIYIFSILTKNIFHKKYKISVFILFLPMIIYGIFDFLINYRFIDEKIFDNYELYIYLTLYISFFSLLKNIFMKTKKIKYPIFEIIYIFLIFILNKNFIYIIPILPMLIVYIVLTIDNGLIIRFNIAKFFKCKKSFIKKVSVIVPNYNYSNYIVERIDSILKQNYPIYELIILDDCSTDDSEEVILNKINIIKEKQHDFKIKYIPNETNSGNVFKQWLKCFEIASGDYIWICEADDLCSKYFLNTVMNGFKDEKVVISYSESSAIDENGRTFKKNLRDWIDIYKTGAWDYNYVNSGFDELSSKMCINNTIANVSSVVFKNDKKIDFKKYLIKAQEFNLAGDWYFYSKILLHGKIAYFAETLNYHRIHSNSVTTTTDNFIHYKEVLNIQDSICKDVKVSNDIIDLIKHRNNNLKKNLFISDDEIYYDKINLCNLLEKKGIHDEILLSIVIPVYNVEEYIGKCLKSIFKQLPEKTEVIVINDGSLDNSEDIILEYKNKYKNLKYIKKNNGGLSSVKNLGLKEAKGRYIIFLDSDDYVSSNMYSTMLKKAIDRDADLVYCDILKVYENGKTVYYNMTNYEHKDKIMQIVDNNLMAASWNKMVNRNLYNGLEFPEGINNEDVAVSPLLLLRAHKIEKVESPFYKYFQRTGSIQNSEFSEKRLMIFDTSKICFDAIKNYNYIYREMIEGAIVTKQLLALLIWPISEINNREKRIEMIKLFCQKFNNLNLNLNNQYIIKYLKEFDKIILLSAIEEKDYDKIDLLIQKK